MLGKKGMHSSNSYNLKYSHHNNWKVCNGLELLDFGSTSVEIYMYCSTGTVGTGQQYLPLKKIRY